MSIQAVAWALEQDLPARPKLVLVSIANHANHIDGYCWLKAETIAKEAACTPRSIYNFVGALVRNGFIRKQLRKGEDGKQRANDYWILFDREEKEWDSSAHLEPDEGVDEPSENASEATEAPDVVQPSERPSPGETPQPSERHDTRQAVEIPAPSPGPSEAAFTRKRIAEPSKTNPKEERAGARVRGGAPRGYRPPPPQPLGAVVEGPKQQIFVYQGTRAWDAWVDYKKRTTGHSWSLTRTSFIDGKHRTGWWFPSLFPPSDAAPKSGLSEEEAQKFADTG